MGSRRPGAVAQPLQFARLTVLEISCPAAVTAGAVKTDAGRRDHHGRSWTPCSTPAATLITVALAVFKGVRATRKPMLLLRFSGWFLLR